ncbi:MAG: TonB-dependent receptor plug domain-containing protein [Candidatus Didemnitutus sp.]|nr:TonB-dependent receptor plug domain-containing protein [Candidatus Didemnitutus sp.]
MIETNVQPAAPAADQAASPSTAVTSSPRLSVDPDVTILSPFDVKSDRDYGYLKINSATATRIGTEIQKVPLNISVISEEFMQDTTMKDIQDILRYQSSSAGDGRMGIIQPATGFTPSGIMTLRGFPINSRLRNGLLRYNAYSLDNVERIEVIKGPAAVFFGNAFPGGVINYITKAPSFSKIPTTLSYSYSGYDNRIGGERVTLDHNAVLSDKAAMRIVGAWDNGIGDARHEFQQGYSVNAGLTLKPLKSGRLKIAIEGEVLQRFRNQDDTSYIWPQQWLADYKAPPANLIAASGVANAAAYQTRIFNNVGNWIADVRKAAGNDYLPLYTSVSRGAFITDAAGNLVQDKKFNYYGSGTYTKDENSTFSVVTDFAAADWFDVRHSFTEVRSRFDRVFSAANPYADGRRFNMGGVAMQGYEIDAYYHQLDMVFKKELAGVDNKLLLGGLYGETYNSFYGSNNHTNLFPFYGYLPGAWDKPDEGYVSPIPTEFRHPVTGWGVREQFIRDRFGKILTPQQIFSEYDPGVHMNPDIRRITPIDRGLVDHSRPERKEWYANWQASMMDDRLIAFLGYREEETTTVGQLVAANPPWFVAPDFALQNIPQSEWVKYGLSAIFSRPRTTNGSSKMAGVSFEVVKNVSLYASYSQTFLPSGVTYLGGDYDPNAITTRATLLGLNPATELARLVAQGGLTPVQNETGKNAEFGVKVALNDNKLVGTMSVFRVTRQNRVLDDTLGQANEPLNYLLPNKQGGLSRIVRWYSASATEENEGAEFEAIWTPIRNYQAVVSGSWMWSSKLLADPSLAITPLSTTAQRIQNEISFASRLVNAPEFRFNFWNKYTFTDNFIGEYGRGFSIGLGMRYSSEINIQNNVNFWGARGGLTAGDYVVFDSTLSYPFELFGYQLTSSLNVGNVTDKEYLEGNYNLAEPRSYRLSLSMKF